MMSADPLKQLNAVIGLVKLNDIDSARDETMALILSALHRVPELAGSSYSALNSTEITLVKLTLKSYFRTIENSLGQFELIFF